MLNRDDPVTGDEIEQDDAPSITGDDIQPGRARIAYLLRLPERVRLWEVSF
jgi:hypothetical protein